MTAASRKQPRSVQMEPPPTRVLDDDIDIGMLDRFVGTYLRAAYEAEPDFPWHDYDIWDPQDFDGDGIEDGEVSHVGQDVGQGHQR